MAYNPRTYNLNSRYRVGQLLDYAVAAFARGDAPAEGLLIPAPNRNQAYAQRMDLHRWRKAFQTQKPEERERNDDYADLIVGVVERDGNWYVHLRSRALTSPAYDVIDPTTGEIIHRVE